MGRRNGRFVLAFDPSGAFNEGNGTTGWCILNADTMKIVSCGCIKAENYLTQSDYWDAHLKIVDAAMVYTPDIVIEDYFIYRKTAQAHINSHLETSQLIGILKQHLFKKGLEAYMQPASTVVNRWNNNILIHKGHIAKSGKRWCIPYLSGKYINQHQIDSIRHAIHYATFVMKGTNND